MIGEFLDRFIGVFAPGRALERMSARATMSQINDFGAGQGSGLKAGKKNRLTRTWAERNVVVNAFSAVEIERSRARAWDLYHNSPAGRKLTRTTTSKVIGRGLFPRSQALTVDGESHDAFRQHAERIWREVSKRLDYRGLPAQGGQSFVGLAGQALRQIMLTGEVLYRLRPIPPAEALARGIAVPLELQLIHAERLDVTKQGPGIFRGIEFDERGRRKGYWILSEHPSETPRFATTETSQFFSASEIFHLYFADDVDQIRGLPWLCPAIPQMHDTADYQYNELRAAAVGACVVMGIRRPTGAPTRLGVNLPTGADTEDADGTPITAMQPGQIFNLGQDGALEGFNPARPATNAEAWISHMQRTIAAAVPGCKSSTLTGDYRNSSFSSERSADNDAWPEIEEVQDWLAEGFCQPIYEAVIRYAVALGLFDGIVTADEYAAEPDRFNACIWAGPVARSINPTDDAAASEKEIEAGVSSLQIECAKRNRDWKQVIRENAEVFEYAMQAGLPEHVALQFSGLSDSVLSALVSAAEAKEGDDAQA